MYTFTCNAVDSDLITHVGYTPSLETTISSNQMPHRGT